MRTEIPNLQLKYKDVEDLSLKWDLIKMEIRGFSVKHSKNQAKVLKSVYLFLECFFYFWSTIFTINRKMHTFELLIAKGNTL